MPEFTQTGRAFRFESPLGADALMLQSFVGEEATSRPFLFTVELLSESRAVVAADLLGKDVSIVFELEDGERTVRGIVRQFARLGRRDELYAYRAEVVPWLWLATLRTDIRSFQQKTVPEIVQAVLKPYSTHVKLSLTGTYPPREYCVQYQESDFDFVSRLMEEEGISYFFTHAASTLTMVLADAPSALETAWATEATVLQGGEAVVNRVFDLADEFAVQSDKVTVATYYFETPSATTLHTEASPSQEGKLERYEFLPAYDSFGADGKRHASVRLDAHEAQATVLRGASSVRALQAGAKIGLEDGETGSSLGDIHLLSVRHEGNNGDFVSSGSTPGEYRNAFIAIPAAAKYRPPRVTPLPRAYGLQTAVVVGPSGEEIYVDKYGRVKVQFRWDRLGTQDDKSSAWVRVSQAWAGKGWGFLAHPRIGQEVLVEFVDGNPDHPVITGRVYNAESMMPYAKDSTITQSGIRSRSTKQGADDAFNELLFDDKKDSELVSFQAQKDLTSLVKNDESREVQHDRKTTITNDDTRTVAEGNDSIEITKGDRTLLVKAGKQSVTVKGDDATVIQSGNQTLEVQQGNQSITIAQGDQTVEITAGKHGFTVQGDHEVTVKSGNQKLEVSTGNAETKVSVGNATTTVSLGDLVQKASVGKVTVEATGGIELKCGANSIVIDQSGVTIKGLKVGIEGQVMTEVKGLMVKLEGSAMATVKGGITMIN